MVTFQKAKIKELTEIRHLLVYTWIQTYKGIFSPKVMSNAIPVWYNRKLLKEQITDADILFDTAKNEKGEIVGIVAASRDNHKALLIRRLYVYPKYQRKHIGIKLMKHAIESFGGISILRLEVVRENRKARRFYLRHGFKMVRTHKVAIKGGMFLLLIVMERPRLKPKKYKNSKF